MSIGPQKATHLTSSVIEFPFLSVSQIRGRETQALAFQAGSAESLRLMDSDESKN